MIKDKLDEYLEFDSNLLFDNDDYVIDYHPKTNGLVRVFGGAIRDIIADQKINDVDILVGSLICRKIESVLGEQGYIYIDGLIPKDLAHVYSDIRVINEPRTWMKGTKIVQLIRPVIENSVTVITSSSEIKSLTIFDTLINDIRNREIDGGYYERGFINLIQNVDMSCCVSWDGKNLYENYPNAILHCRKLYFIVNKKASMYSRTRNIHRISKLTDRGWTEIQDGVSTTRDIKIESLLGDDSCFLPFVNEYNIQHTHPVDKFLTPQGSTWLL